MAAITVKALAERMDAFETRLAALEAKAVSPAPAVKAPAVKAPVAKTTPAVTVEKTYLTTPAALAGAYKKGDIVTVPASAVRCVNANVTVAQTYKGIVTGVGSTPAKNMSKAPVHSSGFTDAITIAGSGKTAAVVYVWQGCPEVKVVGRYVPVATVA